MKLISFKTIDLKYFHLCLTMPDITLNAGLAP